MNSFSQGALTFMSQNIGAGKFSRLNKIAVISCSCAAVTGLVLGNAAYIFGHQLLSIYDSRPEVIEAGLTRLFMVCCFYCTCGLMDCIVGNIRGMGYAITPTIISLVGACGLRIIWIFTFFRLPQFHTESLLFVSYPVSWIITFTAHFICYQFMRKKYPKTDKIKEKDSPLQEAENN
jgi:Na+-driven multidrug efflux pump